MIRLEMNRQQLIDKLIEDNKKRIVRESIISGKIEMLEIEQYTNYASKEEMLSIFLNKKKCMEYINVFKLNREWFEFLFNKYFKEDYDDDIAEIILSKQAYYFEIEDLLYVKESIPHFREKIFNNDIVKQYNGRVLAYLCNNKLANDRVIYELYERIGEENSAYCQFNDSYSIETMQSAMMNRVLTNEEIDYYVERVAKEDAFIFKGAIGILFASQVVKTKHLRMALDIFEFEHLLPGRNILELPRWLLGLLRLQNLDEVMDILISKMDGDKILIDQILQYNTRTSSTVLLKLVNENKESAYSWYNTGYPVLEAQVF